MGLRLARRLRASGEDVVVLDRPETRHRLAGLDVAFRPIDVTDPTSLPQALDGATSIVHLAAVLLASEDSARLERVNHQGTRNVLAAAAEAGVRRIVHVSSISVLYRRQNAYSLSKRRAEDAVVRSAADWTILRPALAWGDPAAAEFALFRQAVERWPLLPLPRGGRARKRPVHVDDLGDAFAACLSRPATIGRILSLAGPRDVSLAEMAREIRRSAGRRGTTLAVPVSVAALLATTGARALRRVGIRPPLDWQTLTGLLEDANPPPEEAIEALDWTPRPWEALP